MNTAKQIVDPSTVAANPDQPRRYFDPADLELLGASLAHKQQQPVTVRPHPQPTAKRHWQVIDGERRWRAAKKLGLPIWIVVDGDITNEQELHTASFSANFCRAGHTHAETAAAIDRELQTGKSYAEIAALVGKSESWAVKEHSLLKLAPEVIALIDPPTSREDRIPNRVAMLLTSFPPEKQMKLWNQYKAKGVAEAFHHIRTKAASATSTRSSNDDVRYILGGTRQACGMIRRIHDMPQSMLGRLTSTQRSTIAADLRTLAQQAQQTADLLEATSATAHDEEDDA
jgi:ParB family chromosome partitioning protein